MDLFDRIINIDLIKKDGTIDKIVCPESGMKPDIRLQGEFVTSALVKMIEVRITNFYPSSPLNEYSYINIYAGYRGSALTTLSGQIWIAYTESPGPDGVTYIQAFLGNFRKYTMAKFDRAFPANSASLSFVLGAIAQELGLHQDFHYLDTIADPGINASGMITVPLYFKGYINDSLTKLTQTFPSLIVYMDSTSLVAYPLAKSKTTKYKVDIFSSPPRREAWGWTFVAPWIPQLRPGDIIEINPKYYQQTFVTYQNDLSVQFVPDSTKSLDTGATFKMFKLSFEFSTNQMNNQMSCMILQDGDSTEANAV